MTVTANRSRPTMAAIAREAGVSVPTVSKVLNGWSDVAPGTRRRVEELLDRRGYVRRTASSKNTAAAGLIEVVLDSLNNSWAAALLGGIESACHEASLGVAVSVARTVRPGHMEKSWLDQAVIRGARGVLLALVDIPQAQRTRLDRLGIPYVVVDPVTVPPEPIASVGAANFTGGMAATQHLISLGHKRIAVIGGPADLLCSQARIAGYRAAMSQAGLPAPEQYVRSGDFHTSSGSAGTHALMRLPEPPTAIFICADTMALGAYRAVNELGMRVPDDLSIVGFDDRPESHWVSPRLTTVRQPLAEMGGAAVNLLLRLMRGDQLESRRLELSTSLVERESTAAPKAR